MASLIAVVFAVVFIGAGIAIGLLARMERQTEEHFEADVRALDDEMSFINREELALVPQMDEPRRRFLESLAKKCRDLTDRKADDPAVQRLKADVHFRLGTIYELLGRHAEAEGAYRESIALRSEFGAQDQGAEGRRALADACHRFANLSKAVGHLAESEGYYRRAIDLYAHAEADERAEHAEALHDYGKLLTMTGRLDEGEQSYRKALEPPPTTSFRAGRGAQGSDECRDGGDQPGGPSRGAFPA